MMIAGGWGCMIQMAVRKVKDSKAVLCYEVSEGLDAVGWYGNKKYRQRGKTGTTMVAAKKVRRLVRSTDDAAEKAKQQKFLRGLVVERKVEIGRAHV